MWKIKEESLDFWLWQLGVQWCQKPAQRIQEEDEIWCGRWCLFLDTLVQIPVVYPRSDISCAAEWGLSSDVSERWRSELYQVLVEAMKANEINQENV